MVAAEVRVRRPSKGGAPRRTLAGALREGVRQLLPEPYVPRPYRPPTEYGAERGKVCFSDGMSADYEPTLFTKALAAVTLGLYIGVPQIILALAVLSFWSLWARLALAAVLGSAFLPLRPLFSSRFMHCYLFQVWRRYFKFSFVFDQSLGPYDDYVIAQFPHGAFPLGCLVGGTFMATEFPEYSCYALAANNSFFVPIWRHVHTWMGTMAATEKNFRRLLALGTCNGLRDAAERAAAAEGRDVAAAGRAATAAAHMRAGRGAAVVGDDDDDDDDAAASGAGADAGDATAGGARLGLPPAGSRLRKRNAQGVAVGVMVGGIAEMYLLRPDYECIKLLDRKGFVRIAIEHGANILPVYMLGVSRMLSFGPPWLMSAARRLRMSLGVMYGVWGTPIPRRVPLRMAVGVPVDVGPAMQRSDPGFEARVEKVHAAYVEAIKKVYYTHRVDYGWGDRPLVIV